jgi:hypothetical protein
MEKFKNIFEGLKIAYGQYQKEIGQILVVNRKVKHSLLEKMLLTIFGKSIYRAKVRLWELSLLQKLTIVSGVVLILINIILIIFLSLKILENLNFL